MGEDGLYQKVQAVHLIWVFSVPTSKGYLVNLCV